MKKTFIVDCWSSAILLYNRVGACIGRWRWSELLLFRTT